MIIKFIKDYKIEKHEPDLYMYCPKNNIININKFVNVLVLKKIFGKKNFYSN